MKPTLLAITTQLKAEAFYLKKCKITAKAFHFFNEKFLISRVKMRGLYCVGMSSLTDVETVETIPQS